MVTPLGFVSGCDVILRADDYRILGDDCDACLRERCVAPLADCPAGSDCARVFACTRRCRDPRCVLECAEGRFDIEAWPSLDVEACAYLDCAEACHPGPVACVGDYRLGGLYEDEQTQVRIEAAVKQLADTGTRRFPGWTVTACSGELASCIEVGKDVSDDEGLVSFDLDVNTNGFRGHFVSELLDDEGRRIHPWVYEARTDFGFSDYWRSPANLFVDPDDVAKTLFENTTGRMLEPDDEGVLFINTIEGCLVFNLPDVEVRVTSETDPDPAVLYISGTDRTTLSQPSVAIAAHPGPMRVELWHLPTNTLVRTVETDLRAGVVDSRYLLVSP